MEKKNPRRMHENEKSKKKNPRRRIQKYYPRRCKRIRTRTQKESRKKSQRIKIQEDE